LEWPKDLEITDISEPPRQIIPYLPLRVTVFFLTLAMASLGIVVFLFFRMGATLTSSQTMGTYYNCYSKET